MQRENEKEAKCKERMKKRRNEKRERKGEEIQRETGKRGEMQREN